MNSYPGGQFNFDNVFTSANAAKATGSLATLSPRSILGMWHRPTSRSLPAPSTPFTTRATMSPIPGRPARNLRLHSAFAMRFQVCIASATSRSDVQSHRNQPRCWRPRSL